MGTASFLPSLLCHLQVALARMTVAFAIDLAWQLRTRIEIPDCTPFTPMNVLNALDTKCDWRRAWKSSQPYQKDLKCRPDF